MDQILPVCVLVDPVEELIRDLRQDFPLQEVFPCLVSQVKNHALAFRKKECSSFCPSLFEKLYSFFFFPHTQFSKNELSPKYEQDLI